MSLDQDRFKWPVGRFHIKIDKGTVSYRHTLSFKTFKHLFLWVCWRKMVMSVKWMDPGTCLEQEKRIDPNHHFFGGPAISVRGSTYWVMTYKTYNHYHHDHHQSSIKTSAIVIIIVLSRGVIGIVIVVITVLCNTHCYNPINLTRGHCYIWYSILPSLQVKSPSSDIIRMFSHPNH